MACRQVLAVWPGQTDATYLLGLMAYTYGNLDLAIAHVRQACQAPRAPAVYFSDFAEMCRQKGLLAEGEAGGAARGRARAELRRRLEQSRHRAPGGAQARREPALPRAGAGARARTTPRRSTTSPTP